MGHWRSASSHCLQHCRLVNLIWGHTFITIYSVNTLRQNIWQVFVSQDKMSRLPWSSWINTLSQAKLRVHTFCFNWQDLKLWSCSPSEAEKSHTALHFTETNKLLVKLELQFFPLWLPAHPAAMLCVSRGSAPHFGNQCSNSLAFFCLPLSNVSQIIHSCMQRNIVNK